MPCHADEEGAVVAIVGGPPGLGIGHEGVEVLDDCVEIESFEFFSIVEVFAHGIGQWGALVQNFQI